LEIEGIPTDTDLLDLELTGMDGIEGHIRREWRKRDGTWNGTGKVRWAENEEVHRGFGQMEGNG
jgi:hypothetical protein